MEQIRSFIAIELPEELRTSLKQLQDTIRRDCPDAVRWVDTASIHLTLKFLGSVPSDRLDDVVRAMEQAARGIPPFRLETDTPGAFPSLKRPRVVWVGVKGELEPLNRLQKRVEEGMVPLGFPLEGRFSPHLTLGRVRNTASLEDARKLGETVARTAFPTAYAIPVNAINLMKSELTPRGAIYSRIAEVRLKGE